MKKVLFTVALMFGAMVASAQVSVVKEAKAMKKDPAAAAKVLEAALTNPETANDPETWKLAGDLQKAIYDEENMKMYLPGGQADMPKMYGAMLKMFEYYLKCDEPDLHVPYPPPETAAPAGTGPCGSPRQTRLPYQSSLSISFASGVRTAPGPGMVPLLRRSRASSAVTSRLRPPSVNTTPQFFNSRLAAVRLPAKARFFGDWGSPGV